MLCFDFKRDISKEKKIAQMDFAEYLRKVDVSENGQVYCERFLRNRRHETYCYNNKSS